jgi:hypothetical protein
MLRPRPHWSTFSDMDNTLISRCMVAYTDDAPGCVCNRAGTRAVIEHIAAELVVANQRNPGRLSAHDAAQWLLSQLSAEVIPLRPTTKEPA